MKFIADGMLGKLSRWLRMLGYNVKYSTKLDDALLMKIAKQERRTLLTKDLQLYQRAIAKGVMAFYVEGSSEPERLTELAKRFAVRLDIEMATSRCPKCNTRVKPIPKEKVGEKVQESTFSNYDDFWECPKCEQIYWQGAHWAKIRKTLEAAKENLTSETR